MTTADDPHLPQIIRVAERGLTFGGTRKTLYQFMDLLKGGWSRDEIRAGMLLTDAELDAALCYIEEHREAVWAEYQEVVRQDEESRRYWEERNRARFEEIARNPPTDRPELRARLAKLKAQHEADAE